DKCEQDAPAIDTRDEQTIAKDEVDAWTKSYAGQEAAEEARKQEAIQERAVKEQNLILAALKGSCKAKMNGSEWQKCSPDVGYIALSNGRSVVVFEVGGKGLAFTGGKDLHPDRNDLFLPVDTVRLMQGQYQLSVDDHMVGTCHLIF